MDIINTYDRDSSVPLYGSHLRKWRTKSRDWEQNMQKKWSACRGIPQILIMCTCVSSAQQWFWLASYKVQCETLSPRRAVFRATRCTAPHAVLRCMNPQLTPKRCRALFPSCLLLCTLLELFVHQSSDLSTLAENSKNLDGISLRFMYNVCVCPLPTLFLPCNEFITSLIRSTLHTSCR